MRVDVSIPNSAIFHQELIFSTVCNISYPNGLNSSYPSSLGIFGFAIVYSPLLPYRRRMKTSDRRRGAPSAVRGDGYNASSGFTAAALLTAAAPLSGSSLSLSPSRIAVSPETPGTAGVRSVEGLDNERRDGSTGSGKEGVELMMGEGLVKKRGELRVLRWGRATRKSEWPAFAVHFNAVQADKTQGSDENRGIGSAGQERAVEIRIARGDITQRKTEAIVNAANAGMRGGGGVDGAIHRACGEELLEKLCEVAPDGCRTGQCVVTEAFGSLKDRGTDFVIHAVGPAIYANEQGQMVPTKEQESQLYDCYRNSLAAATAKKVRSVAFPSISTGIFGFPIERAAEISTKAVVDYFQEHGPGSIESVTFAFTDNDRESATLRALLNASCDTPDTADTPGDTRIMPDTPAPSN